VTTFEYNTPGGATGVLEDPDFMPMIGEEIAHGGEYGVIRRIIYLSASLVDLVLEWPSPVPDAGVGAELARGAAADALLREVLDQLCGMTSEEFGKGGDRVIRRRIAEHLRLNPDDYSL
jgi:hypothetical protein